MSYGQKSRCDPGPCGEIPGLVYNPENHQCAWPDEMGCSLRGQTCEYSKWILLKLDEVKMSV